MGSLFLGSGVHGAAPGRAVPAGEAEAIAHSVAHSTKTVAWIMAGIMAAAFLVARFWMPKGRAEDVATTLTPATATL